MKTDPIKMIFRNRIELMTLDTIRKDSGRLLWWLVRTGLLFGLSFILVYPMLFMLSNSFKPVIENYDPSIIWIPKSFTLSNFANAVEVMRFPTALLNTFTVNMATALIQIVSCMIIGYGFARFRFTGRGILFAMVLITIIVPQQTIASSLYKNFADLKLINSNFIFYIPALLGMGLKSGLYIFVFRQFFRGLPKDLDDAATVDGCGTFKIFYRIMLPNALPALLTVFLFSVVWQWSDFYGPAMYLGKSTIATALYSFTTNLAELPGVGNNIWDPFFVSTRIQAACLLSVAPLVVIYIFTQRFFVEGIERTGLVG
jgi:multiple sugar transport system permease protein